MHRITVFAFGEDGAIKDIKHIMDLQTNLIGRLRNTNLPKKNVLFPLFEAVVNSIHSIDDRIVKKAISNTDTYIRIEVMRSSQKTIDGSDSEICGFKISDNGMGFTEKNFKSFQTLDSDYKIDKGCKGIGRLLWLKAFNSVSVVSTSQNNEGKIYRKEFKFDASKGISDEKELISDDASIETTIQLIDVLEDYKKYIPQEIKKISQQLLEHCLWYFLRQGSAPKITIYDKHNSLCVNDDYDLFMQTSTVEKIDIKGNKFDITHIKFKFNSSSSNKVFYSAANRLVKTESIKIPGLFGTLNDDTGDFYYMCFVCSDYLTENVNSERLDFNIPEKADGLFENAEVSFEDIRQGVNGYISAYLEPFLVENKKLGIKRIEDFVDNKAPKYKPILNHISPDDKIIDPSMSDKDVELFLHKQYTSIEEQLLKEGHDLMKPSVIDDEQTYSTKLKKYLSKSIDIKKSDLANYVTHRKVIIDLFEKAINRQSDGKYVKESIIHKLIMPMVKDSDEVSIDDCNLWLLDERLAFHNYLASDTALCSMPITDVESSKEPDLIELKICDNPLLVNDGKNLPLASITIVEFKRPMRNDIGGEGEDKNPIDQALDYLDLVRKGKVKTKDGRPIPESSNIPGFCYILCDLNEAMIARCNKASLIKTSDNMGFFGFNPNFNAYIEVFSFDRLVNSAKERNRAFFDKLGLPTT